MWQLELLSRVIPAFGALARTYSENEEHDARLRRDSQDCYSDMVTIGLSLCMSCGEWASGLIDEDLIKLLTALETRFPKPKRSFPISFSTPIVSEMAAPTTSARSRYPQLSALAASIERLGWNGFDECSDILNQSRDKSEQLLTLLGRNVLLFHKEEKRDSDKRNKFIKRIRRAAKHLLEVYCRGNTEIEAESFNLPQHPSHGMKDFANTAYNVLERHWRCKCSHWRTRSLVTREARLSLIRHRQMGPKLPTEVGPKSTYFPARFEILLPLCKDDVDWKVANIEVKHSRSYVGPPITKKLVNNDVCQYLLKSDNTLQVNFEIENESFWHLKPEILEDTNQYASMEPLRNFLGDGLSRSYISTCKPKDQLLLCYILANSMLYLYPSSWIQTEWSSNMLYFIRRSSGSSPPILTFPYMSAEIRQNDGVLQSPPDHMQSHTHPAILALGIIFLEIITGTRFTKSSKEALWQRCNEDALQARRLQDKIERQDYSHRTKRVPSGLIKAVRACLKLEPPPNFPINQLTEEGPIRYYILTCIVGPLVYELQTGYKVRLDNLHTQLIPGRDQDTVDDIDNPQGVSRRSTANMDSAHDDKKRHFEAIPECRSTADPESSLAERREACLFRGREEPIDERKERAAAAWFEWHYNASDRVASLRRSTICNAQRIKIAILDSGIELSDTNKDIYNFEPKIQYKSWIDEETEWRDEVGHGTHLATLLRKIAPNAMIYVGRVFKIKPKRDSARVIAQAIRHAVDEWEVDIIAMSFGFGEKHELLAEAIQHAASNQVVMFAAASNDGKNRPDGVAWPARDVNVICVHSGDGHGTPSTFTPDPQDIMRIMVLGECVTSAWPQKLQSAHGHKLMSGTSCATPIAAGIAALVLDHARGFLTSSEWKQLRHSDSIRRVFESMSERSNHGYWWVRHWKWFDSKSSEEWIKGEVRRILY
ncbi:hypothetical protein GQ44DRAFT_832238 [Phaeosphaeriaceae sp. PMI808]|nr:hypothetical protein GQ44DRAFT_832238 [Phaeosphaeriaceae sp. PMI808]